MRCGSKAHGFYDDPSHYSYGLSVDVRAAAMGWQCDCGAARRRLDLAVVPQWPAMVVGVRDSVAARTTSSACRQPPVEPYQHLLSIRPARRGQLQRVSVSGIAD